MNLYENVFYLVKYSLDTVSDDQPTQFQIHIWADTGFPLKEYWVEGEVSDKKLCAYMSSFLVFSERSNPAEKTKWRFTSILYEDGFNEFAQELLRRSQRYQTTICHGYISNPDSDLNAIFEKINQHIQASLNSPESLDRDLKASFKKKDKAIIANHIDEFPESFKDALEKECQKVDTSGLTAPLNNELFSLRAPFSLSSPDILGKMKLKSSLNQTLSDAEVLVTKRKI